MILDGTFQPGEKLPSERQLAQRFSVSRAAVREALSALAGLAIVSTRRGSGTYVSDLRSDQLFAPLEFALTVDPNMLLHLFELRRICESVAARMAAERMTESQVTRLREDMISFDQAFRAGEWIKLRALDEAVHTRIAEGTGNPLLTAVLKSINSATNQIRMITGPLPTTPPATRAELLCLVAAIEARDPLRAEAAMLRHLVRIEEDARAHIGAVKVAGVMDGVPEPLTAPHDHD